MIIIKLMHYFKAIYRPAVRNAMFMIVPFFLLASPVKADMESLSDEQLSTAAGQALFTMSKTLGTGVSSGVTFYKVGLDVDLALNANIKKLQLGCGGINGAGVCDIDFDNFSLTGQGCANRPDCLAVLTRPFMEFAIANDATPASRALAGFRFSAELLQGLLTVGINDGTSNGINRLSGYMSIAATTGTTSTAAGGFTNTLTGKANIGGCIAGCPAPFTTANQSLSIPSMSATFNVPAFVVNGQRLTALSIAATSNLPDIPLTDPGSGFRSATMDGCFVLLFIPLCGYSINKIYLTAQLHGLTANVSISEKLGYIHSIPLNNPFSLSLQKTAVRWPGQAADAQLGWWMSISDPIQLGSLSTPSGFQVDISSAYSQVATKVSAYLNANPVFIPFGDAVGTVFNAPLHLNPGQIDLTTAGALSLNLTDLPLGTAQNVVPNCWGTSKFC